MQLDENRREFVGRVVRLGSTVTEESNDIPRHNK